MMLKINSGSYKNAPVFLNSLNKFKTEIPNVKKGGNPFKCVPGHKIRKLHIEAMDEILT